MADVRRSADSFDRVLTGRPEPDDALPGFGAVAELVRALTAPATTVELAGRPAAVAAASALLTSPPPSLERARHVRSPDPSRRTRSRFFRAKAASLVFAGALLGTSGLAAAGVLPDPVQDVAHDVLSKVGIHVPSASDDPSDDPNGSAPAGVGTEDDVDSSDDGTAQDPGDGAGSVEGDTNDEGETGNPHDEGETGNPHDEGETGNPHDEGETGNPHDEGETGNPHDEGETGNPHDD